VNNVNRAPVITVPANLTQAEGTAVSLTANATDADAGDTITMTQAGKPASLTFTPSNGNPASATITGTLSFTDAVGSPYSIVWTATDNGAPKLRASGTTVLTVYNNESGAGHHGARRPDPERGPGGEYHGDGD
jgi:hypothetical protein